jgi:hypothetical protein
MISNHDGIELKSRIQSLGAVEAVVRFMPSAVPVNASRISTSSSRGPGIDQAIKPEMLGVGTSVYTASLSTDTRIGFQVSSGTSFSSPMIAGAAAVLKAARQGLTSQQYRSLLINGTGTFTYDQTVPAPIQQTGAGLLNLFSSISSTITAVPQTINFGSGGTEVRQEIPVTLSNIGTNDDMYSLEVAPLGSGPAPVLSDTSVAVAAGKSREVRVRFEGSGLTAGQYQGFVVARSSISNSQAHIPYWYGVPSNEVDQILVADPPESGSTDSVQELYIRPSDASGFAVDAAVTISALEGGGSVSQVRQSRFFPGFWLAEVRLGPQAATNLFEVNAGGKTTRVSIVGR